MTDAELVVTHVRDADGTMRRVLRLSHEGALSIVGHDLGAGVERFFGGSEYEFSRRLSVDATDALLGRLGITARGEAALAALAQHFGTTSGLEKYLETCQEEIPSTFWSRVGG